LPCLKSTITALAPFRAESFTAF